MASLQVREFPPDLYVRLKERARDEHRSISQQTIVAIQEHLGEGASALVASTQPERCLAEDAPTETRIAKRKRLFAELEAMPKATIPDGFPSPAEIVREMRDSR